MPIKKNTTKQYKLFDVAKRKLIAKFGVMGTKEQKEEFQKQFDILHAKFFDKNKFEFVE